MVCLRGPFEVSLSIREHFLRLRRHPNIVIIAPRENDKIDILLHLNDERIYVWFNSLPFPFTLVSYPFLAKEIYVTHFRANNIPSNRLGGSKPSASWVSGRN
jgi:hypothetical protein